MKLPDADIEFKVLDVTSKAFGEHEMIPRKYSCEGEDVNPPLEIKHIPETAKSLVIIVEGTDEPPHERVHWIVWNIPPVHKIHENEMPGDQGLNDFGRNSYSGPCPSSGTGHYSFKVYALDDLIELPEGSQRHELETAMSGHILAYGEITGLYKSHSKH